ncbi:MAG: hypothetical protein H6Q80_411 [Deltaproteobacteria bacterium]|jgi:hypothetical protein|nr:hypothetical protein [Deltaproteobacteria bacterium]
MGHDRSAEGHAWQFNNGVQALFRDPWYSDAERKPCAQTFGRIVPAPWKIRRFRYPTESPDPDARQSKQRGVEQHLPDLLPEDAEHQYGRRRDGRDQEGGGPGSHLSL